MRVDEWLARGELGQIEQQHPGLREWHSFDLAGMRGQEQGFSAGDRVPPNQALA
jgi:hypothetical protein